MWVLGHDKMRLLENSPKIAPLLARLQDYNASYQTAMKEDDTMERIELAKVMVDMLRLDLKPNEGELVTDVLLELMRQAEIDLRQALAVRLAPMDNIPLRMVLHLANDDIRVAEPVLRQSPVLHDMDLVYIIQSQHEYHWRAIATRRDLTGPVINVLAETGDVDTAVTLAENKEITLTDYALDLFVPMAGKSEKLAQPLLTRTDVPQDIVARLYNVVGEAIKQEMALEFGGAADIVFDVVDSVVEETKQVTRNKFMPSENLVAAAYEMKEKNQLNTAALLGSLKRGLIPSFIAQFAAYADIPARTVMDMITQTTGQSLAVACSALKIKKSDFISFYLMSHRVRQAAQPIIDNHHLSMAIRTYDAIRPADAVRLLKESQIKP